MERMERFSTKNKKIINNTNYNCKFISEKKNFSFFS